LSNQVVAIPAEESSVLVDNLLSFKLFDVTHQSCVMESFSKSSSVTLCTPIDPESGPYSRLHHFVTDTQHTPNDIIAAQADCPDKINLHEFMAFSGLRCGPRLQWLNIARELATPSLSFNREEVHTLITQAAWQLGPLSNGIREWHVDLSVSSFGNTLLCELESRLEKIKANWQEEVTVRTISMSDFSGPHSYISPFVSSYLWPSFGIDNGCGRSKAGMSTIAGDSKLDVPMDQRYQHKVRPFARRKFALEPARPNMHAGCDLFFDL
jgi:hypothetical protein